MGERENEGIRMRFDGSLRVEFRGVKVTSDAGLLAYREFDEAFGLTAKAAGRLVDTRSGANKRHKMEGLLRQAVYSRLAGYEDTNDAWRLREDPAMRQVVGGRAKESCGASTSEMARFETEMLTLKENLAALEHLPGLWSKCVSDRSGLKRLILDMDSTDSPTHGKQEGAAYNGYFGCTCYHPLFCFNQHGDLLRAMLREGNVHSADDWEGALKPIVEQYKDLPIPKYFRGDAAFASPELYKYLEANGYRYVIRLKANAVLEREVEHLLKRPEEYPSGGLRVYYRDFRYQAGAWDEKRRVVAKVEWRAGELFPQVGFIATNLTWSLKRVVKFYNKRGTVENWIKEGKYALKWTRLSCHDFKDNQVRLQLFALAYNLGNFLRRLALPQEVKHWTLTTMKEKLIKIGAKVVKHARYVVFQMAEVAVSRRLFAEILGRIVRLRWAAG